METKFTLSEMENIHDEALECYFSFANSLEEINSLIDELSTSWVSDETHTYEIFKDMYKQKYKSLTVTRDLMKQFCDKLEEKKNDFQQSSKETINMYE